MLIWPVEVYDTHTLRSHPFSGKAYTEPQLSGHLHKEFGVSPRGLVRYTRTPDAYKSLLTRELSNADDNGFSRHVVIVGPSQASRGYFEERFASRPVFDLLWDTFLKHRTDKMARLYELFRISPSITMTVAAGWIFESRTHQLVTRRKTIQLFSILLAVAWGIT